MKPWLFYCCKILQLEKYWQTNLIHLWYIPSRLKCTTEGILVGSCVSCEVISSRHVSHLMLSFLCANLLLSGLLCFSDFHCVLTVDAHLCVCPPQMINDCKQSNSNSTKVVYMHTSQQTNSPNKMMFVNVVLFLKIMQFTWLFVVTNIGQKMHYFWVKKKTTFWDVDALLKSPYLIATVIFGDECYSIDILMFSEDP